ncbi:UNVERIFIED_CONTAM: hypothetical protein K2H54_072779, partial [Gekko kuhli]
RCRLDPEYGPCRDEQLKVYFNWKYQKCLEFPYGGCKGNNNRFETMMACEHACERRGPCNLPPIQGPCGDYRTRYYYDWTQMKCLSFIYGGCEGNRNRFKSAEACEWACKIKPSGPLLLWLHP